MDLSKHDDVETDGCMERRSRLSHKEPEIITKETNKNILSSHDSRFDSGISSYVGDSFKSLDSVSDKSPVACTEDVIELDNRLHKKLDSLSIQDEGICLFREEITNIESSAVCDNLDIEIDPYETDRDGDTIIHQAIVWNLKDLAVMLIEMVDDVSCLNVTNLLRQSPLHLAVLLGQVDVVQGLVDREVDVTLRDHQGNTPLHIACRLGDRNSVEIIVASFGNDVNARKKYFALRNCEGLTCLHVATQNKEYVIMGHLFAKGADVNMGDAKSGRTVLHYAAEEKDAQTLSLLLTHKEIDVDCKTFKGETPLVMAYWRNYTDIVKRLRSKGAYFSYDVIEDSDDDLS